MFGNGVSKSKMFVDKMLEEEISSIMIVFTKKSGRARAEEAIEATIRQYDVISFNGRTAPIGAVQDLFRKKKSNFTEIPKMK